MNERCRSKGLATNQTPGKGNYCLQPQETLKEHLHFRRIDQLQPERTTSTCNEAMLKENLTYPLTSIFSQWFKIKIERRGQDKLPMTYCRVRLLQKDCDVITLCWFHEQNLQILLCKTVL